MKRKKKNPGRIFVFWLLIGLIPGIGIGILLENIPVAAGLGLAVGGVIGIIAGRS